MGRGKRSFGSTFKSLFFFKEKDFDPTQDNEETIEDIEGIALKYQNVFRSPEGREVLFDIMNQLHFWVDEITSQEEVILINAAKRLLKRGGGLDPRNVENILSEQFRVME